MPEEIHPTKFATDGFYKIHNYPSCCSVMLLTNISVEFCKVPGNKEPKAQRAMARLSRVGFMDKPTRDKITRTLPANARKWPSRIWASFILQDMYNRATSAAYISPCAFIIADRTANSAKGDGEDRLLLKGSGFAEFCKRVPGVTVTTSEPFAGAHGGLCRSYTLVVSDPPKLKKYIDRSRDMLNQRIDAINALKRGQVAKLKPGEFWV